MDKKYGSPRIQVKAINQKLLAFKLSHRKPCENIITLASAIRKAEVIGMLEDLRGDTVLAGRLAEKLPTGMCRTKC